MSPSNTLSATGALQERPFAMPGRLQGLAVYIDSLGCAKNQVDSEAVLGLLAQAGCTRVHEPDAADLLVLNTCGFLEAARAESVDRILELAQLKSTARPRLLAVLGCLVARAAAELRESLPEVDLWLPAGQHGAIVSGLSAALAGAVSPQRAASDRSGSGRAPLGAFAGFGARVLLGPQHSTYLKISEGCSNTCSFCSIPLMRGTQRSRPMADIVAEARALAARGVREVHLVAQDLTHYGFDLPGRPDLVDLTRELAGVEGIVWVRLLYAHPAHLTRRMQEQLFGVPKVLPYLDMPIQHASDTVLRAMRRPYTAARVRQQVLDLRRRVAGITLRTTVIVGFPGENERDFAALCRFVEEMRFDRLGVFAYSREPGTASYALPGRPRTSSVERRMHELSTLQMHIAAERAATRLGTRTTLLVDGLVADLAAGDRPPIAEWTQVHGRTPAEALDIDGTVFAETVGNAAGNAAAPGDLLEIEIVAHDVFDLRARVLPSKAATDGSTARPEP